MNFFYCSLIPILLTFYLDDTNLKTTSGNFDKVNQINAKFDEAYDLFIIAFPCLVR